MQILEADCNAGVQLKVRIGKPKTLVRTLTSFSILPRLKYYTTQKHKQKPNFSQLPVLPVHNVKNIEYLGI